MHKKINTELGDTVTAVIDKAYIGNTRVYKSPQPSDGMTSPVLDKRRLRHHEMSLDDVYYVVHLVSVSDDTWHHTSLIAADSGDPFLDGLLDGIADIKKSVTLDLQSDSTLTKSDIDSILVHTVFIRNLNADHPDVVEAMDVTKISAELSSLISTQPDIMKYVVVGIVLARNKEKSPFLVSVAANDAVAAIDRATVAVQTELSSDFRPLFSTIQAQLTSELFAKYAASSKKIRDFVLARHDYGGLLH
jgi:hypothetical protein